MTSVASSYAQFGGGAAGMVAGYMRMEDRNSIRGKLYKRMSIGYGTNFMQSSLSMTVAPPGEGKITKNVTLETSRPIAAFSNTFFVISQMGEQSGVVLDVGINYAAWNFSYDSVIFRGANYTGIYSSDIPMLYAAVPLSIDFKTGGEMSLRKEHKHLFTAGVGIAPVMIGNDLTIRAALKPFVKLEAGFHAGIAFKVRGLFYIGEGGFIKDEGEMGSNVIARKTTGNFGSSIGLVLMPFSWDWEKGGW